MVTMARSTKALVVAIIAILVFGGAYLIWLKSSDTAKYYEYATYTDLKRDAEPTAANVPAFIPPSARQIWGWYDVDSNVSALEFQFDGTDQEALISSFERQGGGRQAAVERKVQSYRWKHELPRGARVEAFSGQQEGTEYLVIDNESHRAYYVSEP
jgi:hypothetical protein